jgi:selenide, water dikinase
MIDREKRKRVMGRSIALGHCICNPKQSCPCPLFKDKNVCLCAGERLADAARDVALTELVENAGCASKISQADLKEALAGLPQIRDPRVLVGAASYDDAGVYRLDGRSALVQTVDVFTPNVDDPYLFGQIAAANSVSDIYAMGGRPITALSIIGFPIETLSPAVMNRILRGGLDKMREAGVAVIGGHSIKDAEVKFGFAVTGLIRPDRIVTNDRARPGDVLVLTKPLGTGIVSFARQLGRASAEAMAAVSRSMAALNRAAAEIMAEAGVVTATDVTGFGLAGHLSEMAVQSGVTVEVEADLIPVFPEALDYIHQGIMSGALERNREYAAAFVEVGPDVAEELESLLYDPQTSGGLLIAVPEKKAARLVARLKKAGVKDATVIGRVVARSKGKIMVKSKKSISSGKKLPEPKKQAAATQTASCCPGGPPQDDAQPGVHTDGSAQAGGPAAEAKHEAFLAAAQKEGAIPHRTKELMALSLALLARCESCIEGHLQKAKALGISEEEIAEAVWLAVSYGGTPVLMLYESVREKV